MIKQSPLLRAAPLTALLFAISACSTQHPASPVAQPQVDAGTGARTEAQEPQDPQGLQSARDRFLIQQYLRDAEAARRRGNNDLAKTLLLEANNRYPENREISITLQSLLAEMGEPAGTPRSYQEHLDRRRQIIEDRARAEVQQRIQSGQQAMEELRFDFAIEEFRAARLRIRAMDAMDWGATRAEIDTLISEARERRREHETELANQKAQEALALLRAAEDQEQARITASVNRWLLMGQNAFRNQEFKLAQEFASRAIELAPTDALAVDLYNAANKAMRSTYTERYWHQKADQYLQARFERERLSVPQTDVLKMEQEAWQRAEARAERLGASGPVVADDPADVALRQRVATTMVQPMTFTADTNGAYTEVYSLLATITDIPILISAEGAVVINDEGLQLDMDMVAPMSLASFLDHMASRSESLAWTIRDTVVLITNKTKAGGNNVLKAHDIRSLVFQITEFLPPRIHNIPTGTDDTGVSRTGGESDEKVQYIEIDALVDHIKTATNRDYWETGDSGASIEPVEGGYLLVKANPKMQREVEAFIADMNNFSTAVVTIETKFLTINENWLQEMGFDVRGMGGAGNKGAVAPLDDITNGLDDNSSRGNDNSGTGDTAASPLSGFFYDDGGDGDVRGRTENFFGDNLGNILTPSGGLTAAWTFLDDLQVNMIFSAVEKSENAQIVNAQTVTVLNNNRANVAVINQTSYVRDFDVEVAQASFIADPKIDVIHDGVVLDVKPIIRHDRKSVTLNLQPTVAELVRPIPTFTTSLAGTTLPVTLQLPQLTVKSLATTAQVPDGGSVLIGGLRTILARERRAEVPFFAKLPILSFFFKQEGVVDESSSLMVLVKAQITEVRAEAASRTQTEPAR